MASSSARVEAVLLRKKISGGFHGLAGLDEGGEVEDGVEGFSCSRCGFEKVFNRRPVSDVSLDELRSRRKLIANGCG